jgi:hypothetical protein
VFFRSWGSTGCSSEIGDPTKLTGSSRLGRFCNNRRRYVCDDYALIAAMSGWTPMMFMTASGFACPTDRSDSARRACRVKASENVEEPRPQGRRLRAPTHTLGLRVIVGDRHAGDAADRRAPLSGYPVRKQAHRSSVGAICFSFVIKLKTYCAADVRKKNAARVSARY